MKVFITGITGLRNRGVEALVVSIIEQMVSRRPDLTVNLLTQTPEYDEYRLQRYNVNLIDERPLHVKPHEGRLRRYLAKYYPFYKPHIPQGRQDFCRMIQGAAGVIVSGGDLFSTGYGPLTDHHLMPLELALSVGVPVFFLAQSIGPFKTQAEVEMWLSVAHRARLITIREKLSYQYVTKDLGLSKGSIKCTADPAFLLTPPSQDQIKMALRYYGVVEDQPLIGIAMSQGISHYANCNYDKHLETWCQVVNWIINELKAQVLLIPHVQEIYAPNDDRIIATRLLKAFDFDSRIRFVGADHSASELKGLISACDMVIAERMHASIASLSSNICTVVVGYSIKAEGILQDLLGDELARDCLISIDAFTEGNTVKQSIQTAWQRRKEIEHRLKSVVPQVKAQAASNFDLLTELL